jgi:3-oxoacyl-[acyl-carrier protein] reductase
MNQLQGNIAFVTGGSRGIGRACALLFAQEGADIAFNHLGDGERAKAFAAEVEALDRRVFHMECDMGDSAAVRDFAARATAALGAPDILLNNAGMNIRGAFETYAEADYDRMMAVHMKGMFVMAQAVYPAMIARGSGRIINIASQLAMKGQAGIVPYCAAKAGIMGFTRALAHEAAPHGVLVNAIAPGAITTDLTALRGPEWKAMMAATLPVRRMGVPQDIAYTALLLAGPGGANYAGATLSPNGGDVMH